ncbi:cbb3-type cytochrome oxidase assembly protein CcoS [Frateuria sp.]|uniref:cbb3-type cytochrome oxidase assembly protein CcoS n=1 Tax=Frateuria sp. TaxID=2211372 RepID=UPI0039C872FC
MNILLVLIPVTGLVVLIAVALFFWAANHQQFDDLDSPAVLPLMEDEPAPGPAAGEADDPAPPEHPGAGQETPAFPRHGPDEGRVGRARYDDPAAPRPVRGDAPTR